MDARGLIYIFMDIRVDTVSGKHAFDSDDQVFTIVLNGLEEHIWFILDVTMEQTATFLVQDTQDMVFA